MSQEYPYTIRKLKGVIHNKIVNNFKGFVNGMVQVGQDKWFLPTKYEQFAEVIYNFEARPDDVYICTFPRSGTTWTQEMIWLICNDLDYETALNIPLMKRFPFFELHTLIDDEAFMKSPEHGKQLGSRPPELKMMFEPLYELLKAQTTRRFIKTHLPFKLMPRNIREVGAKVVYVARNPQDVAVSFYHFHKANAGYQFTGDFESFVQYYTDDLIQYGPYWKHLLDGWSHRNDENVHFMFYEESKMDPENSLKKLANFLEKPLSDEDLPKLMDHLKFENVRKNTAINFKLNSSDAPAHQFVRRGKVGGNPEMTRDMKMKIDEWTKRSLEGSDLKFPFC